MRTADCHKIILSLIPGCLFTASPDVCASDGGQRNFLFVIVDDLRPELNCYGAEWMKTPHIDSLASTSVIFRNAYCNAPVSSASRASLFTGLRAADERFAGTEFSIDRNFRDCVTLPEYLKANGYVTVADGKVFHYRYDASGRSWNRVWFPESGSATWKDYCSEENRSKELPPFKPAPYECEDVPDNAYMDGRIVSKAIRDLEKLKKEDVPFFLAVGLHKPHLPFNAPAKYWDLYAAEDIILPDTYRFDRTGFPEQAFNSFFELRNYSLDFSGGEMTEDFAKTLVRAYRACVSYADAQVGRLLAALKGLGLDKDTVVVLFGDHGWSLGEHGQWCKHSNFNVVNHVPLILSVPGTGHEDVDNVVELVDLYPTICRLAGLPEPEGLDGDDMMDLIDGRDGRWQDYAIVKWHDGVTCFDRDYGYTEWIDTGEKMLFRYPEDRQERHNIAGDPAYAQAAGKMEKYIMPYRKISQ